MERIISGDKAKMPMTERFYSVNGQMMGYESGGVKKDFLTDHLGSITAEIDQTQTRTHTMEWRRSIPECPISSELLGASQAKAAVWIPQPNL